MNLVKSCDAVFMSSPTGSRESYFMDLCWSDTLPQTKINHSSINSTSTWLTVLLADLVHMIYERLHVIHVTDSIIAFHVKRS